MHSRGELSTMQRGIHFVDLFAEVAAELGKMAERALSAGIAREQIVLDPGIGFGKTAEQSLQLLARLGELSRLGYPLLVGASRKSFLAAAADGKTPAPPSERLGGSLAALAWAAARGAAIVRVHEVSESAQFLAVSAALEAVTA
jgi:dihydropteroate synthase